MQNPLLARWSGPFGGVPPFDRANVEHFKPALEEAMAAQLAEKGVARKLREHVLCVGNTVDPAEGYRAFRGRDPKIDALMRRRGFAPSA